MKHRSHNVNEPITSLGFALCWSTTGGLRLLVRLGRLFVVVFLFRFVSFISHSEKSKHENDKTWGEYGYHTWKTPSAATSIWKSSKDEYRLLFPLYERSVWNGTPLKSPLGNPSENLLFGQIFFLEIESNEYRLLFPFYERPAWNVTPLKLPLGNSLKNLFNSIFVEKMWPH